MIGQTLLHYEVLEKLGEGAMGVLYRARDSHLDRDVALKVLRPEVLGDPRRRQRLVREAKAASALNHPHIVTVHDVGRALLDGHEVDFIAMECIPGRGLDQVLAERRLSVDEALDIALQITEALAGAHAAGIVHRDVKPANVMLTDAGTAKVLDFGLAKVAREPDVAGGSTTTDDAPDLSAAFAGTRTGAAVGTPAYMSPEQAEGLQADPRSDVFALGVVLYEMLAGRRPFQGASRLAVLTAILHEAPPAVRSFRRDVPRDVQRVVERSLAKRPDQRYASAGELLLDLTACRARLVARSSGWRAVIRRPRLMVPVLLLAVAIAGLLAWKWVRGAPERWARGVALPQIARVTNESGTETGNYDAYWLARQAAPHLPGDPQLERFWKDRCYPISISTQPPGAEVFVKPYRDVGREWKLLGRTPLQGVLVPYDALRWRMTKDGFEPIEVTSTPASPSRFLALTLDAAGTVPAGMLRVGGRQLFPPGPPISVEDFWLDRYEVTNRQYKQFVDQGGYRKPEYWKQPFVKDGRPLSWRGAMATFVDASGRPGPATWEAGTYPDGEDDFPVGGVSFYEAAAYAAFAGKELPTFFHWVAAWATPFSVHLPLGEIFYLSNFGGKGPVAVGTPGGVAPYGAFDMAGNVREWSATEYRGMRYAMGGAWTDPPGAYMADNTQSPWTRDAVQGFRCARYLAPLAPELTAAFQIPQPDYATQRPVPDEVFQAYRGFYAYDRRDLEARVESVEETPRWRRERVSFVAAYGNQRVPAHLFLPRTGRQPYQVVVYSPTIEAYAFKSSDDIRTTPFDHIVRSGRAVLHPIYPGTYERYLRKPIVGASDIRDLVIESVKDVLRGLDYLESRPDIDRGRMAMLGITDTLSIIAPALDARLKATIIQGGGFIDWGRPPETDPFHFSPRVRTPALVLAGHSDPLLAETVRGRRLLKLLGAAPRDKRLVFVDSGHSVRHSHQIVRETLDWLDRYLGPVDAPTR